MEILPSFACRMMCYDTEEHGRWNNLESVCANLINNWVASAWCTLWWQHIHCYKTEQHRNRLDSGNYHKVNP